MGSVTSWTQADLSEKPIDYCLCCLQGRAVHLGRAVVLVPVVFWSAVGWLLHASSHLSREGGMSCRDKGHKGPQDQYPIYGDHAIGVMSSVIRASPRDRWPDRNKQCWPHTEHKGQKNGKCALFCAPGLRPRPNIPRYPSGPKHTRTSALVGGFAKKGARSTSSSNAGTLTAG